MFQCHVKDVLSVTYTRIAEVYIEVKVFFPNLDVGARRAEERKKWHSWLPEHSDRWQMLTQLVAAVALSTSC